MPTASANLIRFGETRAEAGNFTATIGTNGDSSLQEARCQALRRMAILNLLNQWLDHAPRRVYGMIALTCLALLGYGQYLQHVVGLNPCPMCIVQRYAMFLVAVCALLAGATGKRGLQLTGGLLLIVVAAGGAYTAARQSWLQWYPPEVSSCGRDLYGMIEAFPLQRVIPMIFKGSGDCTAIDWTFLGGTIANWAFLCFCGMGLVAMLLVWRAFRGPTTVA
jgi:disulfide bond formation protein DsbB